MKKDLNTLLNRVDTRLAACAAAAGASLAAIPSSNADIVWSGPISINIPSTTSGIYLNVATGAFGTAAATPGWDINPWSASSLNFFSTAANHGGLGGGGPMVGTGTTYSNLAFGTLINAASGYVTNVGTHLLNPGTPLNLNSSNNLFGFRFVNELNGNQVHYGWLRISLAGTSGAQPRAIVEFGWENVAGAGITAGAIPEPTTTALLGVMAAGALGIRAWRKRKAA